VATALSAAVSLIALAALLALNSAPHGAAENAGG